MLKKIARHIVEGSIYFGLEIFETEGKEYFSLLQLELKKGELEVALERTSEKIGDLIPLLNLKAPLFLTINTSKVLKKEVPNEALHNNELLVVNAFPNLELDNFYYHILNSVNKSVVAISKRKYIDWYLDELQRIGLKPYSVAIGIAQIDSIKNFVDGRLLGSNFSISIEDGDVTGLNMLPNDEIDNVNIKGIILQNYSLLNFSHILRYIQRAADISNLGNINNQLRNDFKNFKLFHFSIKASLMFFLLLLLGNFLVFNNYNSKNQLLESTLLINVENDSVLQELKKRVTLKEERLMALSNSKNSMTSYYFDEIAKGLPKSIWLSDMKFQPLLNPVRNDKRIEFKKNSIEISGIINDKIAFTVWSDNLEMQKWVNKVEIINYEYISNSSANFTLNIVLNETQ